MPDSNTTESGGGSAEYEQRLISGGELLRLDRVDEAKKEFLAALELKPDDRKALGLLGLACFRLSSFEDARPVYEKLVKLAPEDPSFRLNLGLVYLKLGDADGAIEQLKESRELDPSQSRAVSYLGLAYARNGDYANAYQAFIQAGQSDLAREMEQYLSDEQMAELAATVIAAPDERPSAAYDAVEVETSPAPEQGPEPEPEPDPDPEPEQEQEPEPEPELDPEPEPEPDQDQEVVVLEEPVVVLKQDDAIEPLDEDEIEVVEDASAVVAEPAREKSALSAAVDSASPSSAAAAAGTRTAVGHRPPQPLSEFATCRLIRPEDGDNAFEISAGGVLIVRVQGRIMSRTEGVVVSGGELAYETATRRVRGSATEEPFGVDDRPLFFVSGQGHLVASPLGDHFTAVTLDEDILYLREDLVFAFEERLRWENGHVPGSAASIHMVQFRGAGSVAMRSKLPLLSVKLAPDKVLYVDADSLAGWIGRVVPRLVTPAAGGAASAPFVECSGEGVVLLEEEEAPADTDDN